MFIWLVLPNADKAISLHVTKKAVTPFDPPYQRKNDANITDLHCGAKKLHHFIFAITLSKRFTVQQLLAHIYYDKCAIVKQ